MVRAKAKGGDRPPGRGGVRRQSPLPFSYVVEDDALWFHDSATCSTGRAAWPPPRSGGPQGTPEPGPRSRPQAPAGPSQRQRQLRPYQREAHPRSRRRSRPASARCWSRWPRRRQDLRAGQPGLPAGSNPASPSACWCWSTSRALAVQALRAFSTFEVAKGQEVRSGLRGHVEPLPALGFRPGRGVAGRGSSWPAPSPTQARDTSSSTSAPIQRMAVDSPRAPAVLPGAARRSLDEDLEAARPADARVLTRSSGTKCHRGYTSSEVSVWRDTLDHFDAINRAHRIAGRPHDQLLRELVAAADYPQAVRPLPGELRRRGGPIRDPHQGELSGERAGAGDRPDHPASAGATGSTTSGTLQPRRSKRASSRWSRARSMVEAAEEVRPGARADLRTLPEDADLRANDQPGYLARRPDREAVPRPLRARRELRSRRSPAGSSGRFNRSRTSATARTPASRSPSIPDQRRRPAGSGIRGAAAAGEVPHPLRTDAGAGYAAQRTVPRQVALHGLRRLRRRPAPLLRRAPASPPRRRTTGRSHRSSRTSGPIGTGRTASAR